MKHHILRKSNGDGRFALGAFRPFCGQDGRTYDEEDTVQITTETLAKYVERGRICRRCFNLYRDSR